MRGRPRAERLSSEDAEFVKGHIMEIFPSLSPFYQDAFEEAIHLAKRNRVKPPADVSTVSRAFQKWFSLEQGLPRRYWEVLTNLLAIKPDDLPSHRAGCPPLAEATGVRTTSAVPNRSDVHLATPPKAGESTSDTNQAAT